MWVLYLRKSRLLRTQDTHRQIDCPAIEVTHFFGLRRRWYSYHPCVYELIIGPDNYIGKASKMCNRLTSNHRYAPKADLVRILAVYEPEISRRELLNEEARWIEKLQPTLNKAHTYVRPKWW